MLATAVLAASLAIVCCIVLFTAPSRSVCVQAPTPVATGALTVDNYGVDTTARQVF